MPRSAKPPVLESLLDAFAEVPDPRVERTRAHPLVNVLTISLLGAISGADGWEALEVFGQQRADFLKTFLSMPKGPPSADTFRRVFEALDARAFQEAFRRWLKPLLDDLQGQTIAIDGKTLCGALVRGVSRGGAFHLLHVWAAEKRLLLAQQAVLGAHGEVAAVLELLKLLDLKGATVTADANSCTGAVTAAVRDAGADYVLALKGNRRGLHAYAQRRFAEAERTGYRGVKSFESRDAAHGRLEYRLVRVLPVEELPASTNAAWTDVRTIVQIDRVRAADAVTIKRGYYVTSHEADPKLLAERIRGHWGIENQLHHCLDVTFAEDRRRIRDENGAQNFALVTRYALSMLKREPSKMSVAMKRRKAGWGDTYLLEVLASGFPEL